MAITIWLVLYSLDNNRIRPYADGTEIGYVYIGGKNERQAEIELNEKINVWKNSENLKIEISYQDHAYAIEIDPNVFSFDVNKSISSVNDGKEMNYEKGINLINVSFSVENENYIDDLLLEHYEKLKFSSFDIQVIKDELLKWG